MKILKAYPPNIEKIRAAFDIDGKPVIFTYADTIYVPSGVALPVHLVVHESVHTRQQFAYVHPHEVTVLYRTEFMAGPNAWWERYIADQKFRVEQEIEAYGHQYKYVFDWHTNREKKELLAKFASHLASEVYGNAIPFHEAEAAIKRYAHNL